MYTQNFLVLFVLAIVLVKSDDDCPNSDRSQLAAVRLRRHLLCEYDKYTRPTRDHNKNITVKLRMIVKYFNYDMHDSSFTVDSWMALSWTDEHLTWNPDEYESIPRTHLSDGDIWMPDISIYNNRMQGGDQSAISSANCIISHKGEVMCVPSASHTSICTSDLTKFPFDTHNCSVRFGSWVHSGEEIDFQIPETAISAGDMVPNGEWDLVDTDAIKHPGIFKCCPNNTYPSINFTFKIKRISGAHTASVILPAIALVVLTVTSLWLAPDNRERLNLCYVNLISEFLYVQYVSWLVPMNGDKIPLILLFARDSLLLSAFATVLSLIFKKMAETERSAPEWMTRIVCVLVAFKPGQFVFLGDTSFKGLTNERGEDDLTAIINNQDSTSSKTGWPVFAKILDRLCFLLFAVVYLVMFIAFTP